MNIHAIEEIKDAAADSRPVLAIRLGRGRTGGSTFLDYLVQRARRKGRTIRVADGDRNHATLSEWYPPGESGGALRPRGTEIGDVAEWVTEVVSQMAADQASMVLDMGASDTVLEEHAKQMNLCEFCEALGIAPLAIYSLGPTRDDFNDAMTIYETGYAQCERTLFVMNESLVEKRQGGGGRVQLRHGGRAVSGDRAQRSIGGDAEAGLYGGDARREAERLRSGRRRARGERTADVAGPSVHRQDVDQPNGSEAFSG
jgi:hypothetical protein